MDTKVYMHAVLLKVGLVHLGFIIRLKACIFFKKTFFSLHSKNLIETYYI